MKTEHTVNEMNFPQLSEQEQTCLMGGRDYNTINFDTVTIQDGETPL